MNESKKSRSHFRTQMKSHCLLLIPYSDTQVAIFIKVLAQLSNLKTILIILTGLLLTVDKMLSGLVACLTLR